MSTVDLTDKSSRYLSEHQRRAIIAEVASGRKQVHVAKEFNVHPNTVNSLMRTVRKAGVKALSGDWKTEQTTTAIATINKGLVDDEWVRRGDLGVKVLTGLQVYKAGDTTTVTNVLVNIQDLPRDWYERIEFVDPGDAPIDVKATPVVDSRDPSHG